MSASLGVWGGEDVCDPQLLLPPFYILFNQDIIKTQDHKPETPPHHTLSTSAHTCCIGLLIKWYHLAPSSLFICHLSLGLFRNPILRFMQ